MKPVVGLALGNRYQLVRQIAVGGMGEVWVASDQALGREVAVKVLREEYAGHQDFLERLRTEARNSAALSHPNIAQMHDYGEQQGSGYLVMELVLGEPMADLLERDTIIPLPRLLPILSQTARALHAAHVAGVVHRDVKPGNILLERTGQVKITDFGVSLATNQVPMTAAGMVMGTAQYLSPEQAIGQPATGASDVYALGIVAYESVAGSRPFTGSTPVDIAVAHVNEPVPALPPSVDPELAALIMRMLAKDPKERPRSAAALAQTFDEIAERVAREQSGGGVRPVAPRGPSEPVPTAQSPIVPAASAPPSRRSRRTSHPVTPVRPDVVAPVSVRPPPVPFRRERGPYDQVAVPPATPAPAATPAPSEPAPVAPPERRDAVALPWERLPTRPEGSRAEHSHPARRDVRGSSRSGSSGSSGSSGTARSATGGTRAERRQSAHEPSRSGQTTRRQPVRTSTTTGRRIGGIPKGLSWPLVALVALLLVLLVASLVNRGNDTDNDGATAGATAANVIPSLRASADNDPLDGMILRTESQADASATPTRSKDA